jgi:hypothetical protein
MYRKGQNSWGNDHKTRAEELLDHRYDLPPEVTPHMARSVSEERRERLEQETESGHFREAGALPQNYRIVGSDADQYSGPSAAGFVSHNGQSIFKAAQSSLTQVSSVSGGGSSSGTAWRGAGATMRQVPEVYSPLWLNSNLNLPRDRATINAWCRSFFALNPIVHNAITLHSTYPIAKLNIKSKNRRVETFFGQMIEEIDLMNTCVQIAQEFWTLGEAFVYAELDERTAKWSRLMIQNPDYITVKRSVIAGDPIISLRPDENLRRIVMSHKSSDIQQRKQLDPAIIEHVRRGENIPLNNFYVSHLARRISPYEIRGTGLLVAVFRQLMLFDKLRECYSTDCEVLTTEGFKRIDEITEISTDTNPKAEYVNGVQLDEAGNVTGVLKLKDGIKVACFNKDTEELEYHVPTELHMSKHTGKMLHFHGKKVDTLVTPNHKMWTKQKKNGSFTEWD